MLNYISSVYNKMDDHTYKNWQKIKETFESSGNIDNMFYKRACEIVKTKKDPMDKFWSRMDMEF